MIRGKIDKKCTVQVRFPGNNNTMLFVIVYNLSLLKLSSYCFIHGEHNKYDSLEKSVTGHFINALNILSLKTDRSHKKRIE